MQTGYFTASYVSSVDDSSQPFALWVPPGYSARKRYPLIIALHGSDADHRMIPEECLRLHERAFDERVILLSPLGRGDLAYQWHGEADIWDTINWVKSRYRIDERRQYLVGLSMGGYATWRLATEYPEQWAAIVPICGGGIPERAVALKDTPVWCIHGAQDDVVPVATSRSMVKALRAVSAAEVRYDELSDTGHDSWKWLLTPTRKKDTLVEWLLTFRNPQTPEPVLRPQRQNVFTDLFNERLIISYPAQAPIPREIELLRAEAECIAAFNFGDYAARGGRFIVKPDDAVTLEDLENANHLMIGRVENHRWLKQAGRRLWARHVRGQLQVGREAYLSKSLVAATCQTSPWNLDRLLGVITYQQFQQVRGFSERLLGSDTLAPRVNLYDTQQRRFIVRADKP